ncbi:GUN4 domain-containing protein [Okeania sp.]|uniref:GUN4 domain-containing protein n=1 Tax=Okeania sp. TaxID=3100323 RepID=UPI002B4AB4BE|nr:GUN4 domain-containing protein [Okeania sp.]MEB3341168.1 GUN4 domain-containing protein [Okeania sp.]
MTEPQINSTKNPSLNIDELQSQLESGSEKKQLQVIPNLAETGDEGLEILMEFLQNKKSDSPTIVQGKIYQVLLQVKSSKIDEFIQKNFPLGVVPIKSEYNIDYNHLQIKLAHQDFLEADKLTMQKLCELAGEGSRKRKWLYFSEVDNIPIPDMQTINTLWLVYSEGKFGYSVQREMWLAVGKNWDKLLPKIGWKNGNSWSRYPNDFTWNLTAPKGHLPLANLLRGVRMFTSILSHPAWSK